ncbi:polysaccharide deacetylase family sporulation protein PdaB [Lentibacillus sp. N15]|uniref:polysaccharide deacetylase family sporulation protein PdaB n=1 Tax=Lentibacillus songyuanensis TaxID=3136161 RepID=UPI0031B9F2B4
MQHFYTFRFTKSKRWIVIILLALFTATCLWFERDGAFSVLSAKDEPSALSKGNKDEESIALTFNISWGEEKVFAILKRLKQENIQATFFVSGEWAERHPEIIDKITEGKHELGMLGYRYKSYLNQEPEQVKKDLLHAKEVFQKLGYEDMKLVRPPNGQFDEETIKLAKSLGLTVIHWNVNPNDWKNPGTDAITDFVMKQTSNGDIILLHASDSVKQTDDALKTILPGLKNKGFHFVPISEFINQAHAKSKAID